MTLYVGLPVMRRALALREAKHTVLKIVSITYWHPRDVWRIKRKP